jgi:hypothetical protein
MDEADKAMHVLFEIFSKPMKPFKGIGPHTHARACSWWTLYSGAS